jgi:hypothetical protein
MGGVQWSGTGRCKYHPSWAKRNNRFGGEPCMAIHSMPSIGNHIGGQTLPVARPATSVDAGQGVFHDNVRNLQSLD